MKELTNARRLVALVAAGALLAAGPALAKDKSGYLGVMLQDVTPAMAKALQLGESGGVLVSDVVDDGPAEKAGLKDGDVIVSFNGKSVTEDSPLGELVRDARPGDKVDVVVIRDGKKTTIPVELGERKDTFAWTTKDGDDVKVMMKHMAPGAHGMAMMKDDDRGWMGVGIEDLDPQLGEYFGVKDGAGVLVKSVTDDSPAAKAGLKAGDVITGIDGGALQAEVKDTGSLHEALAETKAGDTVKVEYLRKGKKQSAEVTLGEAPESEAPSILMWHGQDGGMHELAAPKMMHRYMMAPDAPGAERHVQIIREMDGNDEELQEMRSQLDEMRKELQELRKELKK